MDPVPFFVVDRPMSLKILEYCEVHKQAGRYGLMAHALTTKQFQDVFRNFPGDNIVKAADSGVFSKNGCHLSYKELFDIYEYMDVSYGIMIDYLKDSKKTIESAKEAWKIYSDGDYSFDLVGVAQGKTIDEYLSCYDELQSIGLDHIAIGGLLKKKVNSARYVQVRDKEFLEEVVQSVRERFPDNWLFLLGCYHPNRHQLFQKYSVFGGDYKGWIFNYETPEHMINRLHNKLAEIEKSIPDRLFIDLVDSRKNLSKELKQQRRDKDRRKEIQDKILVLDKQLLDLRKKKMKQLDEKYQETVRLLDTMFHLNKEERRLYRFKQIRSYLEKHVYPFNRNRLLLISCSQRKIDTTDTLFALDLYDGPFYRLIKKMKRDDLFPSNVHTLIISAKYGLIDLYDLVQNYDKKMTLNDALDMKPIVQSDIDDFMKKTSFDDVLICMGKNYLETINDYSLNHEMEIAEGPIGCKLSKTKNWILNYE
jgi:hypothetical protein